ncbi:hypothetical protein HYQ46_010111 [Verticillium longisporum]|nr:hypothetical protein HYQ46_010111 [Verticillium longisporum]
MLQSVCELIDLHRSLYKAHLLNVIKDLRWRFKQIQDVIAKCPQPGHKSLLSRFRFLFMNHKITGLMKKLERVKHTMSLTLSIAQLTENYQAPYSHASLRALRLKAMITIERSRRAVSQLMDTPALEELHLDWQTSADNSTVLVTKDQRPLNEFEVDMCAKGTHYVDSARHSQAPSITTENSDDLAPDQGYESDDVADDGAGGFGQAGQRGTIDQVELFEVEFCTRFCDSPRRVRRLTAQIEKANGNPNASDSEESMSTFEPQLPPVIDAPAPDHESLVPCSAAWHDVVSPVRPDIVPIYVRGNELGQTCP